MVRMKLQGDPSIKDLSFDLQQRKLVVVHANDPGDVSRKIDELNLGSALRETVRIDHWDPTSESSGQRKLLVTVLLINFGCFLLEITTGFISRSMGLVADSLDMLADSLVYLMALFAVGGTAIRKKNIARAAGYFQLILAVLGFAEVITKEIGRLQCPQHPEQVSHVTVIADRLNSMVIQKKCCCTEFEKKISRKIER